MFNFVQTLVWILYRIVSGFCTDSCLDFVQTLVWILYRIVSGFCTDSCLDFVQTRVWILYRLVSGFCSSTFLTRVVISLQALSLSIFSHLLFKNHPITPPPPSPCFLPFPQHNILFPFSLLSEHFPSQPALPRFPV
jgi:hypothetical protein